MVKKVRQFYRVPEHSIIARNITGRIDYIDAFSITLEKRHPYSIDEITRAVFTSFPGWVDTLLKLRDALVKPFGLMTGADIEPQVSEISPKYKIGAQAVIFTVIDRTNTEIVMSENDRHLRFRTSLSLTKNDETENDTLFLTTLVQFHNIWGRLYFVPVKPLHKLIMKSLLMNFSKACVHRKAAVIL